MITIIYIQDEGEKETKLGPYPNWKAAQSKLKKLFPEIKDLEEYKDFDSDFKAGRIYTFKHGAEIINEQS